jgi:hypothetical protein
MEVFAMLLYGFFYISTLHNFFMDVIVKKVQFYWKFKVLINFPDKSVLMQLTMTSINPLLLYYT